MAPEMQLVVSQALDWINKSNKQKMKGHNFI